MKELLVFTYICVSNRIAAIYGALNNASGFYNTQLIFYWFYKICINQQIVKQIKSEKEMRDGTVTLVWMFEGNICESGTTEALSKTWSLELEFLSVYLNLKRVTKNVVILINLTLFSFSSWNPIKSFWLARTNIHLPDLYL